MAGDTGMEPMLDMFVFETTRLIEQLEQLVLDSEKKSGIEPHIDEIFRIMHTIKGCSSMMLFDNISSLSHAVEDVFYHLRENKPEEVDYSKLTDIVLGSIDFIKAEIAKIEGGQSCNGDAGGMISAITSFLSTLKADGSSSCGSREDGTDSVPGRENHVSSRKGDSGVKKYKAVLHFEEGCEMENMRAFSVVHKLEEFAENIRYDPRDIIDDEESIRQIREYGFTVFFETEWDVEKIRPHLDNTMFLRELILASVDDFEADGEPQKDRQIILDGPVQDMRRDYPDDTRPNTAGMGTRHPGQSFISVSVNKVDKLMDLVGELVISESMVTQNPDLKGLQLENFNKAARQLKKISGELQDIIMSMRMVPLSATFQKMNRILRDMGRKLKKEVELEIIGEETAVDKNIIEHISDPLMHLIRNSVDHGIETVEERMATGKPATGRITLEAKSAGGDVWIIVKDDGRGLDKEKILKKARENGLVGRDRNGLTDRDIYSLILLPGFSTKDSVTEFSGRGVGMDVVVKNVEKVGGTVLVDSREAEGTTVSIKIPLTLAIIDGMIVKVGRSSYVIPTVSIIESFGPKDESIVKDTEGREMIMVRGDCLPVLRLHELYNVKTEAGTMNEGIVVMVESGGKYLCIFADALLGQQQVVVKALPRYIRKIRGISGLTLLGDGSISLILDIESLVN